MKDLSKYISNKFEKTPSLNNYITEKVLIGKNTKFSKNTAISIIPHHVKPELGTLFLKKAYRLNILTAKRT